MKVAWNVFAQVMNAFIVLLPQVQCPASQLWPSSCADRSVLQAKFVSKSDCTRP